MFVPFNTAFLKSVASVYSVDVETGAETVTVTAGVASTKDGKEENSRSSIKRTENIEDMVRSYLKRFQTESRDRSRRRLWCRWLHIRLRVESKALGEVKTGELPKVWYKTFKEARYYDILRYIFSD